jgi:hypothetical protein
VSIRLYTVNITGYTGSVVATWTGNETIDSGQALIYGSSTAAGETGIHTVARDRNVGKNICI